MADAISPYLAVSCGLVTYVITVSTIAIINLEHTLRTIFLSCFESDGKLELV